MAESSDDKIDGLRVAFLDSQIENARLITRIESISANLTSLFKCGLDKELTRLKALADTIDNTMSKYNETRYQFQSFKDKLDMISKNQLSLCNYIQNIDSHLIEISKMMRRLSQGEMYILTPLNKDEPNKNPVYPISISDLNLSPRLENILNFRGIKTLKELIGLSDSQIRSFGGIGKVGWKELKDVIDKHKI